MPPPISTAELHRIVVEHIGSEKAAWRELREGQQPKKEEDSMIRPDKLASYLAITIVLLAAAFSVLAQDDRSQGSHFKELRDAAIRSVQGTATPASAASAPVYTKADITKDTPCGAPGVGEVWGGERRGQIEYRDGVPGVRVNSAGMWSNGCKMPPPPKDCPETHVAPWRGEGGWRLCTPAKHAPLRAQDVGQEWSTYTPAGREPHGYQRWHGGCATTGHGPTYFRASRASSQGSTPGAPT